MQRTRYLPKRDHTVIWTKNAYRRRHFNRMDPDPDPADKPSPPETAKRAPGPYKKGYAKHDWRQFWVNRLRARIEAPHSTDKDLYDAVERSRRIYLRKREDNVRFQRDPDIPQCYYWTSSQVQTWAERVNLPKIVQDMLTHFNISGRQLITVDANKLLQMGLYQLPIIKTTTQAIRDLLGLPHPNGLRPMARVPLMETFLRMKVPTGSKVDKLTFKQFCESSQIDYQAALREFQEGTKPIPGCCRVVIKPSEKEQISWYPYKFPKPRPPPPGVDISRASSCYDYQTNSSSDSGGSAGSQNNLNNVPTVEEIATGVYNRGDYIQELIDDIMDAVFDQAENGTIKKFRAVEIVKEQLEKRYSSLSVTETKDKFEIVRALAEELVGDLLRSKAVLEDIENFQNLKTDMSAIDMAQLHQRVGYYVRELMHTVAKVAMDELETMSTQISNR